MRRDRAAEDREARREALNEAEEGIGKAPAIASQTNFEHQFLPIGPVPNSAGARAVFFGQGPVGSIKFT